MLQTGFTGVAKIFDVPRPVRFEEGVLRFGDLSQDEARRIIKLMETLQRRPLFGADQPQPQPQPQPRTSSSATSDKPVFVVEHPVSEAATPQAVEVEVETSSDVKPKPAKKKRSRAKLKATPGPEPAVEPAAQPKPAKVPKKAPLKIAAKKPEPDPEDEPEADLSFEEMTPEELEAEEDEEAGRPPLEPVIVEDEPEPADEMAFDLPDEIISSATVSDVAQFLKKRGLSREATEAWCKQHQDRVPVLERIGDRLPERLKRLLNMLYKP